MRLDRLISRGRVADLASGDLEGALAELLALPALGLKPPRARAVQEALLQREGVITTYLGHGVALPHVRLEQERPYVLAVGRSREGIPYEGLAGKEQVHVLIVLLASEKTRDYLQVLAAIARAMREQEFVRTLVEAPGPAAVATLLQEAFGGARARPVQAQRARTNRLMFRHAERLARGTDCTAVFVFGDTAAPGFAWGKCFEGFRTVLVSSGLAETLPADQFAAVVQARSFSRRRLAQFRSALLVGMTRRVVSLRDRVCCIGGAAGSDLFDTILIVDLEREFQSLLADPSNLLPPGVKPEVFERVLGVATELAVEGREGRPVGSLFVLGDSEKVAPLTRPLVLNPFFGYAEEDRNLLSPFMDETLKEYSSLDGAFVIRGDGVVVSAGSLIVVQDVPAGLPSGLGARHAAAAAISRAADCIAVVVSSGGQVNVFRRGLMLPLLTRGPGEAG